MKALEEMPFLKTEHYRLKTKVPLRVQAYFYLSITCNVDNKSLYSTSL